MPTSKNLPIRPDNRRRLSRRYKSGRISPVDSVDNANRCGEALLIQSTAQILQEKHRRLSRQPQSVRISLVDCTSLALDVWITDLKTKEEAFLAAAVARTETDAARQVGIVKETRTAAEAAYRSLVDTVNALAMINGDTDYATFIDHVNLSTT